MAGPTKQERLFPDVPDDEHVVVVNDRCIVRTQDGLRIVLAAGVPLAQYAVGDRMAEAHAMVSLVEQGWADQNDIAPLAHSAAHRAPYDATSGASSRAVSRRWVAAAASRRDAPAARQRTCVS